MAYQPSSDEKTTGMLAHLLAAITWFVGPLVLFLVKGQAGGPFVKFHSKQALVWGIGISILGVGVSIIMAILGAISAALLFLGWVLLAAVAALNLVFAIQGVIKVNNGEKFIYPKVAEMFCKDELAAVYGDGGATPPAGPTPPAA